MMFKQKIKLKGTTYKINYIENKDINEQLNVSKIRQLLNISYIKIVNGRIIYWKQTGRYPYLYEIQSIEEFTEEKKFLLIKGVINYSDIDTNMLSPMCGHSKCTKQIKYVRIPKYFIGIEKFISYLNTMKVEC